MTQFRAASTAIALVFSFLIIAAGNASAQTPPAATPAPSAAPQAAPAASAPKKPIAVIHFSPQDTSMVGSSDVPVPIAEGGATGNHQYNTATFRPGYAAQIYSGNVFASYTRLYVDQNNGRVTSLGNDYVYPNRIYDRVDDASLNVSIDSIIASAGFHQRVRQCCGNNPGAEANPTAYHYLYVQGATRLGPNSRRFGRLFGLTLQAADAPHNTSPFFASPYCTGSKSECLTPAFGAIPSQGNKVKITYTGNVTYPIGNPHTSSFALFATYFNDWDYFANSPIMYLYNRTDIGFIKKISPAITLTVNDSNEYQYHQIFQYVYPNTINRNKLIATLDFAVPIR